MGGEKVGKDSNARRLEEKATTKPINTATSPTAPGNTFNHYYKKTMEMIMHTGVGIHFTQ